MTLQVNSLERTALPAFEKRSPKSEPSWTAHIQGLCAMLPGEERCRIAARQRRDVPREFDPRPLAQRALRPERRRRSPQRRGRHAERRDHRAQVE